jgi:uncharacterized protein
MHATTSESQPGNTLPVQPAERIIMLDALRGIALLGILMMNMPFFALPFPVQETLELRNEWGTINEKAWYFVSWFLEGSQRALFSLLFGAGIILFITRLEKRLPGIRPAEFFLRRQLWLLVFGLFNAFILLWPGDILFQYAICGVIAFVFYRLAPKGLFIAAFVCLVLMTARENRDLYKQKSMIRKGEAIEKLDTTKVKLTEIQKEELGAMVGFREKADTAGMRKQMEKNEREVLGTYSQLYENISNVSAKLEFFYTYYGLWDVLLFMFLGMAFFKMGILTGQAPARVYWFLFILGLGLGLLISYFRLQPLMDVRFNKFLYTKRINFEYYELSRTLRSLGIFGGIMLLFKSGWFNWLKKLMQPVGQMAFTNYLMQSFICLVIFYGIGFGMYGKLERYQIYYVVGAIWILEIIWSHIWLRYFRYGPLEWLWRSLTYWKRQPLKKNPAEKPAALST